MRDADTVLRESMDAAKRVQQLPTEQRNLLLFALIGRMIVLEPDALIREIEWAEKDAAQ